MLLITMEYKVECDTCDFALITTEDWEADDTAKQHEAEHPDHFVMSYRES